eukprot:scaffold599791_cov43-Prasinocladus_malaysianus.AAC.1
MMGGWHFTVYDWKLSHKRQILGIILSGVTGPCWLWEQPGIIISAASPGLGAWGQSLPLVRPAFSVTSCGSNDRLSL